MEVRTIRGQLGRSDCPLRTEIHLPTIPAGSLPLTTRCWLITGAPLSVIPFHVQVQGLDCGLSPASKCPGKEFLRCRPHRHLADGRVVGCGVWPILLARQIPTRDLVGDPVPICSSWNFSWPAGVVLRDPPHEKEGCGFRDWLAQNRPTTNISEVLVSGLRLGNDRKGHQFGRANSMSRSIRQAKPAHRRKRITTAAILFQTGPNDQFAVYADFVSVNIARQAQNAGYP